MHKVIRLGTSWRILGPAVVLLVLGAVACGSAATPGTETTAPEAAAAPVVAVVPTAVSEAMAAPEGTTETMTQVHPGKVTVMVSALGNERFDKTFSSGADKNQGRMLHGMLIETNEKTELLPGIASEWGISSDGLAWNFTIREGVQFHDGTELTPEDVRWTLDHQYGPAAFEWVSSSTAEAFSKLMESVELSAPNVVTTKFKQIETAFPGYNSAAGPSWLAIIPAREALRDEVMEAAYDKSPIGTGPLEFVRHVPAEVIEWERFGDYYFNPDNGFYEDRRVNFTSLDLRAVPEEATRVAAMRAGEADIAPVSLAAREQVEKGGGRLIFGREGGYFRVILVGCWSDPNIPCGDKRVRHALAYALDKELMRDSLYGAEVMELKGWAAVTPSTIGYSPDLDPFPYDPDKARQLLAEAGYKTPDNPSGKDFDTLVINTWVSSVFPFLPESAQLAADMWNKELGIDVDLRVGEETSLKKAHRAGDLHGTVLWRDNETRLDAASISRSSYGNPTTVRRLHDDQTMFNLVDDTLAVFVEDAMAPVLNSMYKRMWDEHYEVGLGYINIPWAAGPRVASWEPYPLAFWLSSYHTITLK